MKLLLLKCFLLHFTLSEAANILVLLPFFSHTNTFLPVFKELAKRGHNVTMVSPFPQKESIPNWTDITINNTVFKEVLDTSITGFINRSPYTFFPLLYKFCASLMALGYEDKNLQSLIQAEDLNYDLLILEPLFAQESLIAFGHKLNIPVVSLYPFSMSPWPAFVTGNHLPYSSIPNYRTRYTGDMSFIERVDNTLVNMMEFLSAYFYYYPIQEKLMEKHMVYRGSENRPSMMAMLRNVSVTLLDYHFSLGYVTHLLPNTVPVGGLSNIHSGELPSDLKKYMDEAKNGVIYLSFGSHLKTDGLSILTNLLQAFSRLDQRVLIKWDASNITNKPNNVEIRKWFPQPSILAHPNCKLFISHGGLHGITEAIYFGIPVLGIPFFSDQHFNVKFVERVGFGTYILLEDVTEETVFHGVQKILINPRYKDIALERSRIMKDRPQTALNSAIYWIEYTLRHTS